MFAITGYEFSYAQAPASMKTVLQACWLLVYSFGNVIIVIETFIRPHNISQADEFFLYAGLMVMATLLFMVLARNYKSSQTELDGATKREQSAASINSI